MSSVMTLTGAKPSGPRKIPKATIDYIGGEMAFANAVIAYQEAKAAHALTEGVPAPIAHPLVVEVVNRYGGEYEVEPPPDPPPTHLPLDPIDKDKLERANADLPSMRARIEALEKAVFDLREEARERTLTREGELDSLSQRIAALEPPVAVGT